MIFFHTKPVCQHFRVKSGYDAMLVTGMTIFYVGLDRNDGMKQMSARGSSGTWQMLFQLGNPIFV